MVPTDTDLSQGSSTEQNNKYDTKREVVATKATTSLRISKSLRDRINRSDGSDGSAHRRRQRRARSRPHYDKVAR